MKNLIKILPIIILLIIKINTAQASIVDGTIDTTYKYAWSENIGWINFGNTGGNVHVTDTKLTGYAWSDTFGWINLSPITAGVLNDGNGNLSGNAWGENTGWIDFAGVTIDNDGYFHGFANGTITGQINFNCANNGTCGASDFKVRTDWRPQNTRPQCSNGLDDDGDGNVDYPSDPGCESISDDTEADTQGGGGGRKIVQTTSNEGGGGAPQCIVPFTDIEDSWAKQYIEKLYCLKIVNGRQPTKFIPNDGATRSEITKVALLMNDYKVDETKLPTFPDVSSKHWAYHTIGTAEEKGIIRGYGDGKFRPDTKVSRAEALQIFITSSGFKIPETTIESFKDVMKYAWYYNVVNYGSALNIIQGYADKTFKPDRKVTRAEMAKIAVFVMDLKTRTN